MVSIYACRLRPILNLQTKSVQQSPAYQVILLHRLSWRFDIDMYSLFVTCQIHACIEVLNTNMNMVIICMMEDRLGLWQIFVHLLYFFAISLSCKDLNCIFFFRRRRSLVPALCRNMLLHYGKEHKRGMTL